MCYIKCKQLRPRVDVEIVGGGGTQARPARGCLCRSRSQAGLGEGPAWLCRMYNVDMANSHKPNVITDHTTCHRGNSCKSLSINCFLFLVVCFVESMLVKVN